MNIFPTPNTNDSWQRKYEMKLGGHNALKMSRLQVEVTMQLSLLHYFCLVLYCITLDLRIAHLFQKEINYTSFEKGICWWKMAERSCRWVGKRNCRRVTCIPYNHRPNKQWIWIIITSTSLSYYLPSFILYSIQWPVYPPKFTKPYRTPFGSYRETGLWSLWIMHSGFLQILNRSFGTLQNKRTRPQLLAAGWKFKAENLIETICGKIDYFHRKGRKAILLLGLIETHSLIHGTVDS